MVTIKHETDSHNLILGALNLVMILIRMRKHDA